MKLPSSDNTEPPKIEFPCEDYPVKIMGDSSQAFFDFVMETTESFAPGFDRNKVTVKASSKGRFTSITVFITATGVEQLQAYHEALRKNSDTKIVL
jgi:putative lipoic acid-binding regulatory protein